MKIKDFENYEVTNTGEVINTKSGKVLKQYKSPDGYLEVYLYKDGKRKYKLVHRLVAEAFIPNPDNLSEVNHRDEDKTNNFVFLNEDGSVDEGKSNLEWCTRQYNHDYGTRNKRTGISNRKTVYQYTIDGQFLKKWSSIAEIERELGYRNNYISECCNGKYHTAYGFKWLYAIQ